MKYDKIIRIALLIFFSNFHFLHFFLNCHHEGVHYLVFPPLPGHDIQGTQNGGNPQDDLLEKKCGKHALW